MKILHINANYIGTALHQVMMNHFTIYDIEHQVFCPTYNKDIAILKPNDNVCVSECFNKWDRICFGYKQNKILKRIQEEYAISSFDCIHAYTLFTDGNIAMHLSRKYGIPYVVAVRDTDINGFLKWKPYLKHTAVKILQYASSIFFLSNTYQKKLIEEYVPEALREEIYAKTRIIPNGIDDFWHKNAFYDLRQRSLERIKNGEIKIVFAGRVSKRKNLSTTQKALQILRNKGWKVSLDFAGVVEDKKLFDAVMRFPNTSYLGKVGKEQLLELYRETDVFVMPSHTETFGLVYAEAMSQGLPVVYSKGQGFDGQFEEGVVGYHAEAKSSDSVADAILSVVEKYAYMSREAVPATKRFNWDDIVREYYEVYNSIVQTANN